MAGQAAVCVLHAQTVTMIHQFNCCESAQSLIDRVRRAMRLGCFLSYGSSERPKSHPMKEATALYFRAAARFNHAAGANAWE
jgi:hypothetical protein